MLGIKCFRCEREFEENEEVYWTDCTEGFGEASYCARCILIETLNGFNNPKLICSCGKKMIVFEEFLHLQAKKYNSGHSHIEGVVDEEYEEMVSSILDRFSNRGMLYFSCNYEDCEDNTGIGVYTCQRDEVDDLVWEHGVQEDELEHEYVYNDFFYTTEYHKHNSYLYEEKYRPDWKGIYDELGIELEWAGWIFSGYKK